MKDRISILLPLFGDRVDAVLARARRAEALGLAGAFVLDHFVHPVDRGRPVLEGPTILGAVASVTSRIRVGSLVLRASARPAWTTAHVAWTLQAVSEGRMVLGLGAADRAAQAEFEAYGLAFGDRGERLEAVRRTIEAVSRSELALPGVDRPEIWVGGRSATSRRLAATVDGWNMWGGAPGDLLRGAQHLGELAGGVRVSWGGKVLVDSDTDRDGEPDLVAGGPERVARQLSAYLEAGADELVLAVLPMRDPETLERFVEEVVPLL